MKDDISIEQEDKEKSTSLIQHPKGSIHVITLVHSIVFTIKIFSIKKLIAICLFLSLPCPIVLSSLVSLLDFFGTRNDTFTGIVVFNEINLGKCILLYYHMTSKTSCLMSNSCLLGETFLTSDTDDSLLLTNLRKTMSVLLELQDTDDDPLTKSIVKEKLPDKVKSVPPSSESKFTQVLAFRFSYLVAE